MAMFMIFLIGILWQSICFSNGDIEPAPGQCLSRYDYDYKVLKKLLDLGKGLEDLRTANDNSQAKTSVAFMAQLSESIVNPTQGSVIVFDSVVTNIGEAYNPDTGTFVAHVDGLYNFQLFAASPKKEIGNWLHLYMMRNTEQVGYVWLDDNNDRWVGRSTSIVIHLHRGDRVTVKIGRTKGTGTLAGCCFHTHFNGFLIKHD